MIEKLVVRKMLASYEKKLKEEIRKIDEEINNMNEACITNEMLSIWHRSKEYEALHARKYALHEVLWDIHDIRCDEALEDDE